MTQGSFFAEEDEKRSRRLRAPESLNPAQMKRLEAWAEQTLPWISRGALGALTPLNWYADETLEYWRAKGTLRPDWVATIQVRIRQVELRRLQALAASGNEGARLALRSPAEWARSFDRLARLAPERSEIESQTFRPSGGRVIHLRKG